MEFIYILIDDCIQSIMDTVHKPQQNKLILSLISKRLSHHYFLICRLKIYKSHNIKFISSFQHITYLHLKNIFDPIPNKKQILDCRLLTSLCRLKFIYFDNTMFKKLNCLISLEKIIVFFPSLFSLAVKNDICNLTRLTSIRYNIFNLFHNVNKHLTRLKELRFAIPKISDMIDYNNLNILQRLHISFDRSISDRISVTNTNLTSLFCDGRPNKPFPTIDICSSIALRTLCLDYVLIDGVDFNSFLNLRRLQIIGSIDEMIYLSLTKLTKLHSLDLCNLQYVKLKNMLTLQDLHLAKINELEIGKQTDSVTKLVIDRVNHFYGLYKLTRVNTLITDYPNTNFDGIQSLNSLIPRITSYMACDRWMFDIDKMTNLENMILHKANNQKIDFSSLTRLTCVNLSSEVKNKLFPEHNSYSFKIKIIKNNDEKEIEKHTRSTGEILSNPMINQIFSDIIQGGFFP